MIRGDKVALSDNEHVTAIRGNNKYYRIKRHCNDLLPIFNVLITTIMARPIFPTDGLDNLPLAYQQLDRDGEILYVNNAWTDLTGFSFYETVGENASAFITPDYADAFSVSFPEFLNKGVINNFHITLKKRGGESVHVSVTGNVVRDESGKIQSAHCLFHNIEDLIKAENSRDASREKYRLLAENIRDVIWIFNINKRKLTYISPSVFSLRGLTVEEALAEPFEESIDPIFLKAISNQIWILSTRKCGTINHEEFKVTEFRQRRKDGSYIWIEATTRLQTNQEGEIEVLGVTRNIQKRKEAELELKTKTDQIENFFDLAADMLTISDFNGRLLKLNKAWSKILGFTIKEITNKPFMELVHPDDHDITLEAFSKILKGEPVQKFENRYLTKDGSYKWLHWQSVPYKNSLVFSAARDISDRKTYELELQSIAEERKKINEDKDKFISILAHDLRNPFNTLLGFSQILLEQRKEIDDSELESMLKLIHKASHQTYNLLEDLLMWYKNQANKLPFEPELFFFEEQCENVMASIHAHAESKDIRIQCKKDKGKHEIFADINMFKTIVRNLFTNAVKFTPDGGTIELSFKRAGDMAEISVKDNGKGMTEEQIANLWIQGKNTGLGMFLCKEFAERNGGEHLHIYVADSQVWCAHVSLIYIYLYYR